MLVFGGGTKSEKNICLDLDYYIDNLFIIAIM